MWEEIKMGNENKCKCEHTKKLNKNYNWMK